MSAGTKIVQLRDALINLLPYAQTHSLRCSRHPCTCNLERAVQVARQLTTTDPARTGGPDRRPRPRDRRVTGFGSLALLVLLTVHAGAQSTADRAKARGDSLLAVAKCWRFAKAPDVVVSVSSCPDSVEAETRMLPHAPVMHLDQLGKLHIHLLVGQTLQLKGWTIRGFLFLWPAGVDFRGWKPGDAMPLGATGRVLAPADATRRVI